MCDSETTIFPLFPPWGPSGTWRPSSTWGIVKAAVHDSNSRSVSLPLDPDLEDLD
jgi:hypothetical protein